MDRPILAAVQEENRALRAELDAARKRAEQANAAAEAERRRAELAEESARRAWRLSAWPTRKRE
jgi:hypothetical protein